LPYCEYSEYRAFNLSVRVNVVAACVTRP
jgi:hypothetical protein